MPKFGDIVINEWAGNINPHKVLLFVKAYGKRVKCLSLDGEDVWFYQDKDLRLTVVIPAVESHWKSEWQRVADETRNTPDA
jgi:hypothetical protein